MGAAAFSLHDDRSEMLRENDAVHLDMEGSMTPERVKYFVDKAWPMSGGDPLDQSINLAITQAVNEALEEAAKTGKYMTPDRIAQIYAEETGGDIDAEPAALRDFARRMWNEALTEALKPAMSEAMFWSDSGDTRAYAACELIIGAIDAMKIPEES